MNKYIQHLPIKQKIIVISMISSISTVLLASIIFFIIQYSTNQSNLVHSTSTISKIIAVNIHAAILFNDSDAGKEILAALAENPEVISAYVYLKKGQHFVAYHRVPQNLQLPAKNPENIMTEGTIDWNEKGKLKLDDSLYQFYSDYLILQQKIKLKGKILGYIYIKMDISQLYNTLIREIIITFFVLVLVSFLGFLLIHWMQQYITTPILALTSTIQLVSKKQDYSLRAKKYSQDELGELTDGFNTMLGQIFEHETQLATTLSMLKKANILAEQANQSKSDFLASMSHEIRTPMNGVLGMANLMMHTPLNDKQQHYTKSIQNSGKTLLTIINDILDLSKIEANKLTLDSIPFNPEQRINELEKLFFERLEISKINLSVDISTDFPTAVLGDPNRFNQILYNLLGNAIKFTPKGKVKIKCQTKHLENHLKKDKVLLYVEIIDNGTGISEEKQQQLFEPFYQAHQNNTQQTQTGTGLGLAIAKKLCHAMGGEIGCKSQLGMGSTFWFTVCLTPITENEVITYESEHNTFQAIAINFGAKILLAEDNLVNQEVAIGSLEYFGCDVMVAQNGQDALNLFTKNQYDLILMDFSMPIMDGITATKQIRQLEIKNNSTNIPIIALTAHAITGVRQKCLDAGMNDYLSKPFSLTELLTVLKQWLPKLTPLKPQIPLKKIVLNELDKNISSDEIKSVENKDSEIIDLTIIEQLRAIQKSGEPCIVTKIIKYYLHYTPNLLLDLEDALQSGNTEKVWKTAHSLKSSSASIGVTLLAKSAEKIEHLGREGNIDGVSLTQIKHQYSEAKSALTRLMETQ